MSNAMRIFKINYKQQSVSARTKPIQLVLNLNTKFEGKYLVQVVNTGVSLLPDDWDANRSLPISAALASKFLTLTEDLLAYLQYNLSDTADISLNELLRMGGIREICKEFINQHIHQVKTANLVAEEIYERNAKADYQLEKTTRRKMYAEIKSKIVDSGYRLTNQSGQTVDINWFFDLEKANNQEQLIQQAFQPSAVAVEYHQTKSTTNSCLIHEEDIQKYGDLKYIELVDLVKKRKMKTGTISDGSSYDVLINVFNEFDENTTVSELTDEVFLNFFDYLQEERDLELPGFNNYKKWINAVFAFATSQLTMQFNSKKLNIHSDIFERNYERVTRPYLTEEMLTKMLNFQFDDEHKHFNYFRDLFYIQSYTSVSYVDLPQLFKKTKIKTVDGELIKYSPIRRKKTGKEADIMLFDEVYTILEKYNFIYENYSNGYYNRAIKDLLEIAGFTDEFTQERFNIRTKETTYKTAPFYSFIGTHSGRRSYITNMKKRGISDESIMNQSQHNSKTAFDMYVQDSKTINFENFVRESKVNKK